ncbi:MAG: OadG family protein [Calditrichaeota bacterium]|nr:OadG family protein [Calditrichota bacterium]
MLFQMTLTLANVGEMISFSTQKTSALEQGLIISIIGISVVFLGLTVLFGALKIFLFVTNLKDKQTQTQTDGLVIKKKGKEPISGEVVVAISLAIHQNQEQFHDLEETILTLHRITRPYSPWSSKIHVLRKPVR